MKVESNKDRPNKNTDHLNVKKETKNKTLSNIINNTSYTRLKNDSKVIKKVNLIILKEKLHCLIGKIKNLSFFYQLTFVVINSFYLIPLFILIICFSKFNLFIRIASFIYVFFMFLINLTSFFDKRDLLKLDFLLSFYNFIILFGLNIFVSNRDNNYFLFLSQIYLFLFFLMINFFSYLVIKKKISIFLWAFIYVLNLILSIYFIYDFSFYHIMFLLSNILILLKILINYKLLGHYTTSSEIIFGFTVGICLLNIANLYKNDWLFFANKN